MADTGAGDIHARLEELGGQIERKWQEMHAGGAAEGIEREAVSDMRMRHAGLAQAAQGGHPVDELENEISALRLNFERWLARIDADYAKRG